MGTYSGRTIFVKALEGWDFSQRMAEDRIGAVAEGDVAGGDVDVPGGDVRGLLDDGEQVLLVLEAWKWCCRRRGDVAEEDDDAVVGGTDQNGEPRLSGSG